MKKIESLRKELEDVKKKWVEILKLKNTTTEIKNLVGGHNSRLENQRKESVNLKIEVPQCEQQREQIFKKWTEPQGSLGL